MPTTGDKSPCSLRLRLEMVILDSQDTKKSQPRDQSVQSGWVDGQPQRDEGGTLQDRAASAPRGEGAPQHLGGFEGFPQGL